MICCLLLVNVFPQTRTVQVINRCLKQMGIGTGTAAPAAHGGAAGPHGSAGSLLDKLPTSPNASAALCGAPCFGNMMLVADCVDGILSNFQGYSAGLMQGVRAVFQMSCAGAGTGAAGDDTPAAHGEIGCSAYAVQVTNYLFLVTLLRLIRGVQAL